MLSAMLTYNMIRYPIHACDTYRSVT